MCCEGENQLALRWLWPTAHLHVQRSWKLQLRPEDKGKRERKPREACAHHARHARLSRSPAVIKTEHSYRGPSRREHVGRR